MFGQDRGNPFELTPRLSSVPERENRMYSPFDIRAAKVSVLPGGSGRTAGVRATLRGDQATSAGPQTIRSSTATQRETAILAINLGHLLGLAVLWVLFRHFYQQCLRATVNPGLLKQIYSRRSGGELTALWLGYSLFILTMGFFLHQVSLRYDFVIGRNTLISWGVCTLFVAGFTGLKQWLLWFYARLFPVRKEVSFYAFMVMVFSILIGLLLVPLNLMLSYAIDAWKTPIFYFSLLVLAGGYVFHLLRGGSIVRHYLLQRPVHLMLYICTIEIAPLLLVYRYLSDTMIAS